VEKEDKLKDEERNKLEILINKFKEVVEIF